MMTSAEKEIAPAVASNGGEEIGAGEANISGNDSTSTDNPSTTSTTPGGSPLESALTHVAEGWAVFPLRGKVPLTENGVYDATRDEQEIRSLFASAGNATGVGGSCEGRLVVDIDLREGTAATDWVAGSGLPKTRTVRTGGGGLHLVYDLPEDAPPIKSGNGVLGAGIDAKTGAGSYVVLPGSKHPDGGRYEVEDEAPVAVAPPELLNRLRGGTSKVSPSDQKNSGGTPTHKPSLRQLLANPPEEGGRNEWLTKVAGHYARNHFGTPDGESLYCHEVAEANHLLRSPLDEHEVAKTAASVWKAEMEKLEAEQRELEIVREEIAPGNGYLVSGGDSIWTTVLVGSGKEVEEVRYELAMFDLRVVGRLYNEAEHSFAYDCELRTRRNPGQVDRLVLHSADLGDARKARNIFASRALVVQDRARFAHGHMDWAARLLLYLDSQDAPTRDLATHLGWQDAESAYLVPGGAIDANGLRETREVASDGSQDWVGDSYGFAGSAQEAKEILAEVLHFQEPKTASLFGSWWAATLAKHWITQQVSQFPVCAVEAASGSGKTTGFFAQMVEIGGCTAGEGHYTPAVLRNRLAANLSGFVWIDDMDQPQKVFEIARVLTAGGSFSKMDLQHNPDQFELVGSLLLSGEALGVDQQRALRDRTLRLMPPPPNHRKSHRDSSKSQWVDVVAVRERLEAMGGGHQIAGHFLQAVAKLGRDQIREWFRQEELAHPGGGRTKDRDRVLLVGARILDHLAGSPLLPDQEGVERTPYGWVSEWVSRLENLTPIERLDETGGGEALEADNTLTTFLIPKYLATESDWLRGPGKAVVHHEPAGEIWLMPNRLETWAERHGKGDFRTESASAQRSQLQSLRELFPKQVEPQKSKRIDGSGKAPRKVWVLSGELYETIIARSLHY